MSTINYIVKVASGKFTIDGAVAPKLTFRDGDTFVFDQADSSNAGHTLQFSATSNNSGSSEYTTGVTKTGTPGTDGKTTIVTSGSTTDTLYYYSGSGSGDYGEEFSNTGFNTTAENLLKPIVGGETTSEKWGPMINQSIDQIVPKSGGTFSGDVIMSGDLTVNGTTTTLDTELQSVDKLEVGASSSDYGAQINQTGTGNILQLQDNGSNVLVVADGGTTTGTFAGPLTGNASTATLASTVTVVDESSDTSCYPVFITSQGNANYPLKSGDNLSFNSNTGILTSTGFAGHFSHASEASTHGLQILNTVNANNGIAPIWFGVSDVRNKAAIGLKRSTSYGVGDLVFAVDSTADNNDVTFQHDEKMRITSAGKVGIGTDFPTELLDVDANGNSIQSIAIRNTQNTGLLSVGDSDAGDWASVESVTGGLAKSVMLRSTGAFPLQFATNETVKMTIDSGGNVGINDTDPSEAKLSIVGTSSPDWAQVIQAYSSGHGLKILAPSTAAAGGLRVMNQAGNTDYFMVRGDGKVGIKQSTPLSPAGTNAFLHIGNSGLADASLILEDDNAKWEFVSNDALTIRDNNATRMTIDSSGNASFHDSVDIATALKVGASATGTTGIAARAANVIIDAQSSADSQMPGFRAGLTNHSTLAGFFRYTTGDAQLWIDNEFTGNNGAYSSINFRNCAVGSGGAANLVTRMTIVGSTGNVGIGTTANVSSHLTIKGTNAISGGIIFQASGTASNYLGMYLDSSNDFRIQRWPGSGAMEDAITIDTSSGHVKIGAVTGYPMLAPTANNFQQYCAYGFYNDQDTGMYRSAADTLSFATGGGRRMTIDPSGNVGIFGAGQYVNLVSFQRAALTIGEPNAAPTVAGLQADSSLHLQHSTLTGEISQITFGYVHSGTTQSPAYMGFVGTNEGSYGYGDLVFGTRSTTGQTDAPPERLRIQYNGNVIPGADNAQNFGSSSLRWANLYTADMHLSNEGKEGGNEIDGTTGDWTIQEGDENLFVINNKTGKKFKMNLTEV